MCSSGMGKVSMCSSSPEMKGKELVYECGRDWGKKGTYVSLLLHWQIWELVFPQKCEYQRRQKFWGSVCGTDSLWALPGWEWHQQSHEEKKYWQLTSTSLVFGVIFFLAPIKLLDSILMTQNFYCSELRNYLLFLFFFFWKVVCFSLGGK